jgi:hypothetical protein
MSDTAELIIGICILLGAITLTRKYHAWRIKRAMVFIIGDLKEHNAYTPESAIDLPYAKRSVLKLGMRDHRPLALDHLAFDNIVAMTEDGRYYLKDRSI